jgi:hypothetical protein
VRITFPKSPLTARFQGARPGFLRLIAALGIGLDERDTLSFLLLTIAPAVAITMMESRAERVVYVVVDSSTTAYGRFAEFLDKVAAATSGSPCGRM